MRGQSGDILRGWIMGLAPPPPWRPLLAGVARHLGVPLLEVEDLEGAGRVLAGGAPMAAIVFTDAAVRDYAVARRLKAVRPGVPVLVLLRGGRDRALLNVMEMGGDDVLRLPVDADEVALRLRATVRRLREEAADASVLPDQRPFRVGGLVVDVAARRVRRGDQALPLTDTEFELLATMAGSAGRPFSRERLLNQVCGFDYQIDSRVIDVHVRNLRRKVETDPAHPEVIQAVPGVGYCVPLAMD